MSKGVYAYEVTKSNLPTVEVGTFVIDEDFTGDRVRSWTLWNSKTNDFETGWIGVRRERACMPCYARAADPLQRIVRPHGHDGDHGPGEPLRPTREPAAATP